MVQVAGRYDPAPLERIKLGLPGVWYALLGLVRSLTCFERQLNGGCQRDGTREGYRGGREWVAVSCGQLLACRVSEEGGGEQWVDGGGAWEGCGERFCFFFADVFF